MTDPDHYLNDLRIALSASLFAQRGRDACANLDVAPAEVRWHPGLDGYKEGVYPVAVLPAGMYVCVDSGDEAPDALWFAVGPFGSLGEAIGDLYTVAVDGPPKAVYLLTVGVEPYPERGVTAVRMFDGTTGSDFVDAEAHVVHGRTPAAERSFAAGRKAERDALEATGADLLADAIAEADEAGL